MINATGNRMTLEIRRQTAMAQQIARSQIEVSTGKRLQQPSDDPIASGRIAAIRRAQADDSTWIANLDLGLSLANQADTVMRNTADNMARAKELVVSAATATISPADRKTIALELESIAEQIEGFASTRSSLGEQLFQTGNAAAFRFSESVVFTPVPTAAQTFSVGGSHLSQIVRDAASAVAVNNLPAISASLSRVDGAIDHVADVSAEIGVRAARMERLRESHETRRIAFAAERSDLEDTNLTDAIATLNAQTITLEAAQAAFARINRRTLFDILD